jgi:hypothetical protein
MTSSSTRVDAEYDATTLGALHTQGEERRRAVVGSAHVDRSLAAASAFTQPMQDLAVSGIGAASSRQSLLTSP